VALPRQAGRHRRSDQARRSDDEDSHGITDCLRLCWLP
jgi:hypothetical protein